MSGDSTVVFSSSDPSFGGKVKIDVETSFDCPFCRLLVQVGTVRGPGTQVLIHSAPHCAKFEELDVLEFLVACNRRRGGSSGVA